MITNAFMVPHPPLAVAEVGRGSEKEIQKTLDSYDEIARRIAAVKPETIVITSPHALLYRDWFNLSGGSEAYGDFGRFRASSVRFHVRYDSEFVSLLEKTCRMDGFPCGTQYDRDPDLDHGVMVPLYFVNRYYTDYKLVRIGLSGFPLSMHYELGQYIARTAEALGRRTVFIGSGDLSHCLKKDGPYGYRPSGPEYDERIMKTMSSGNFKELFDYDPAFLDDCMECGHRSFVIMAGAMDGKDVQIHIGSHESITGVGYGLVSYDIQGENPDRLFLQSWLKEEEKRLEQYRNDSDGFVKLAYQAVDAWVKEKRRIKEDGDLAKTPAAGVFVSIHKFHELRGCIGTLRPTKKSMAQEIIANGISASSRDPRFDAITADELPYLEITVDELGVPETISDTGMLDVKKYGVICTDPEGRCGVLLPDLEGVDTVDKQLEIACRKGGFVLDEDTVIQRFEVVRHV
ncbi:MAG: TTE1956 family protein [Solobacterium sp.]|nr:TTE1956 family protein [Solobacterium sp.]